MYKKLINNGIPVLLTGSFIGLISTFWAIIVAALLFAGNLSPFLSEGIVMLLIGQVIMALFIALYSPLKGEIAGIQEAPAIVLMVMINSLVLSNAGVHHHDLFALTASVIILTTVITGVIFILLGQFKYGELVRYIPYPIIAGFLAGTGWLALQGGFDFLLGDDKQSYFDAFLHYETLGKLFTGIGFAAVLLYVLNRYSGSLVYPVTVVIAISIFYFVLWIAHFSIAEIRHQGWLLGPVPELANTDLAFFHLKDVNWHILWQQLNANVSALVIVSIISLLLNISGLEMIFKTDIDLNKSLKVTGFANVLGGFFGSSVGYCSMSDSCLGYKMKANRSLSVIAAISPLFLLYVGLSVLNYLPKFVIGGYLVFVGIDLLYHWVYKIFYKISKTEYLIVLFVMSVIILSGFIQGLISGIVIALCLFVIEFSSVSIIKNALSGKELQSNHERGAIEQKILVENGEITRIFMLTGFIFFGTANKLFAQIKERVNSSYLPALKYILFDWRQVTGMDSSTVYSLQKILQLANTENIHLVFTNIPDKIKLVLDKILVENQLLQCFSDLNHGLEWCENQILLEFQKDVVSCTFRNTLLDLEMSVEIVDKLISYFMEKNIPQDYFLIRQGDAAEKLYFIESGCLDVFFELDSGKRAYLQRINTGLFVGEIGLLLNQPRSASIMTIKPSVVYELSVGQLNLMKKDSIEVYAEFEHMMNLLLAKRLLMVNASYKRLL